MYKWVHVPEEYLNYLRENGDKRIPNSDYGDFAFKPFFGVLFEKDGLAYITQVSSPKPRHYDMHSDIDFKRLFDKTNNRLLCVVNLNYMFPVPKELLKDVFYSEIDNYRKFRDDKEKSGYIHYLKKEMRTIRRKDLGRDAQRIYDLKYVYPKSRISKRCLDFKALEQVAHKYMDMVKDIEAKENSMIDTYVYPGTDVLKNKFDIQDRETLKSAEADFTAVRIKELSERPVKGSFDFKHLCAVNKYLFQDLYDWAGTVRTIDMEKDEQTLGGLSVEYSKPEHAERDAKIILDRMNNRDWSHMSLDEKAIAFSKDMADLWKVHCFREGNTRTVNIFCCDFAEKHGVPVDRELFASNSRYMRNSLVAYSAVFSDLGDLSKPEYLHKIVKDALQRGEARERQASQKPRTMADWKKDISNAKKEKNNTVQHKEILKNKPNEKVR